MDVLVHGVERIKVKEIKEHTSSHSGNKFYTLTIKIKSEDGMDEVCLFSNNRKALEF